MDVTTEKPDISSLRINREFREPSNGKSPVIKYGVIVAVILALAAAGYWFLKGTLAATPEVQVTLATLTYPSSANAVLTASGYVVAQQKAALASKATGRLVYLGVEEGSKVKKGEIIARIEDQDVLAAFHQAQANYQLALADSENARRSLDRTEALHASGLASQSDLDAAIAQFSRVIATIRSNLAAVNAASVNLENTRIRAPFDGTVLTKDANVGEVVAPFAAAAGSRAAVVTIADMSSLEVETDVSESNITRVRLGGPCEITLDAFPDQRYQGYVHMIVPTADRAKATVLTKVRFKQRDDKVLPEMSAKVTFLSKELDKEQAQAAPKVTVPVSSVVLRDGKQIVLLVRNGEVTEVAVRTAEAIGDRIVITEGIAQGDQIVVRPDASLSNGSKIKVKS